MSVRLRWRLNPRETGLARVTAGPRGSTLRDVAGKKYAMATFNRRLGGWYWIAGWNSVVPHHNSAESATAFATADEAKAAAMAYVKAHLGVLP